MISSLSARRGLDESSKWLGNAPIVSGSLPAPRRAQRARLLEPSQSSANGWEEERIALSRISLKHPCRKGWGGIVETTIGEVSKVDPRCIWSPAQTARSRTVAGAEALSRNHENGGLRMAANDYSRPQRKPFPRALASMIARKADVLARVFEERLTRQLVHDAQRALDQGYTIDQIATELGLPKSS